MAAKSSTRPKADADAVHEGQQRFVPEPRTKGPMGKPPTGPEEDLRRWRRQVGTSNSSGSRSRPNVTEWRRGGRGQGSRWILPEAD